MRKSAKKSPRKSSPTIDAWTAGVIDSDGCITIKVRRRPEGTYYSLFVIVAQAGFTEPAVIRKLQRYYGGNVHYNEHKSKVRNRKPMWEWQVGCEQAAECLKRIRPYLVGKKDQAQIALEYRRKGVGVGKGDAAHKYYIALRATKDYKQTHSKWSKIPKWATG